MRLLEQVSTAYLAIIHSSEEADLGVLQGIRTDTAACFLHPIHSMPIPVCSIITSADDACRI
jgi:hypothetical protein